MLLISSGASIYQFNPTTGAYVGIFASGGGLQYAYSMTIGPDGNLYVADFEGQQILRYSGVSGAFMDVFATTSGSPYAAIFGPDGNLYIGMSGGNILQYGGTTGESQGVFITAPTSGLDFGGMTFHRGSLFVSYIGGYLYEFNATTGAQISELYSGFTQGNGPRAPVFGPSGNMFVPVYQSADVAEFNGSTFAFITNFVNDSSCSPLYAIWGPDGNLWVLNDSGSQDTVRRYNSSGTFLNTLVTAGSGGLGRATQILYVP